MSAARAVNQVEEETTSEEEILMVSQDADSERKVFITLIQRDGGNSYKFQIDSGATCNVIPAAMLPQGTKLERMDMQLSMYNKSSMQALGKCQLGLSNPKTGKKYRIHVVVVDKAVTPLLGLRAAVQMDLLRVQYHNISAVEGYTLLTWDDIKTEYEDVFQGEFGTLPGKVYLEVRSDITPVRLPLRRMPVSVKEDLKAELCRLEKLGVIERIKTPTDWASSLVVLRKPSGKLWVCIDPQPLNRALQRSHYPLPVIEDVLPELAQAKVFSLFDIKNGYWHVELDKESSLLTTFEAPQGRFRWLRLPFGISPASEYFQQRLDQALENLPGVHTVADDILIAGYGSAEQEAQRDHDSRVRSFLERCKEKNIKLNEDKFKFRVKEVPYIGHLLTTNGLMMDSSKVSATVDMKRPTDLAGVQRIIGLANYLQKFLKQLSDICEPLRQLTKKETEWHWSETHDRAFQQLKDAVCKAPVLWYFDPKEETTVQSDASSTGLGSSIMQNGQPVAFASRALSETEKHYAQIEKEALAIVYGLEKFNQFTYGRKVTVETDHKPLETIHKKPLASAPSSYRGCFAACRNMT